MKGSDEKPRNVYSFNNLWYWVFKLLGFYYPDHKLCIFITNTYWRYKLINPISSEFWIIRNECNRKIYTSAWLTPWSSSLSHVRSHDHNLISCIFLKRNSTTSKLQFITTNFVTFICRKITFSRGGVFLFLFLYHTEPSSSYSIYILQQKLLPIRNCVYETSFMYQFWSHCR